MGTIAGTAPHFAIGQPVRVTGPYFTGQRRIVQTLPTRKAPHNGRPEWHYLTASASAPTSAPIAFPESELRADPAMIDTLCAADLDLLRALDPAAIDWHAARYDSADQLRAMIRATQNPEAILPTRSDLYMTCWACVEDGADYGSIPCLADPHRAAWRTILYSHGIAPKCL